jgi:hypothetical protein
VGVGQGGFNPEAAKKWKKKVKLANEGIRFIGKLAPQCLQSLRNGRRRLHAPPVLAARTRRHPVRAEPLKRGLLVQDLRETYVGVPDEPSKG